MFMCPYRSCSRLFMPALAALMLVMSSGAQAYVTRGSNPHKRQYRQRQPQRECQYR